MKGGSSRARWWTWASAALGLAALVLGGAAVAGILRDRAGSEVPAEGGGRTCRVWKGEFREAVIARCGAPCAHGGVPAAACPGGEAARWTEACFTPCDLYGEVAVCYAAALVVEVGRPAGLLQFGACSGAAQGAAR